MNSKLKPAIIGGVIVGLLSAIPFVNFGNICCCLWALLGGAVAAKLFIGSSSDRVSVGDGALVGVLSGLVGAAIYIVLGIPLAILAGNVINGVMLRMMENAYPEQAEMMRRQMEAGQSIVRTILYGFIWAILLVAFSTLGGLLGTVIFEKRKDSAPPPPQNYGGGSYGSAA
jgi:hypothetical protein